MMMMMYVYDQQLRHSNMQWKQTSCKVQSVTQCTCWLSRDAVGWRGRILPMCLVV